MPRAEPPVGWPFPFDPPAPMKPGDNRAMTVNTTDGSEQWDFAQSFVTVDGGDPSRHTNDAHAYASCTDCETGATAFQVVLIVGQSDEIAPVNAAAAANYHCVRCRTYAFAYQIVASVTEVTPAVEEALEEARRRLSELEAEAELAQRARDPLRAGADRRGRAGRARRGDRDRLGLRRLRAGA